MTGDFPAASYDAWKTRSPDDGLEDEPELDPELVPLDPEELEALIPVGPIDG